MMTKEYAEALNKLVVQIMAEAEKDGEPVTKEEAEEMAKMELKADKLKNYTQATVKKTRKPRERKVDETKRQILAEIKILLEGKQRNHGYAETDVIMENETDLHFTFGGERYSLKLTKHRPPKK